MNIEDILMSAKKGQLGDLTGNVVALVVIAIVIAFGALILVEVQDEVASIDAVNTTAYNATGSGIEAMGTFGDWLPIISVVVVAGVILMLLFAYLMPRTR